MAQAEIEKDLDISQEKLLSAVTAYAQYPQFVDGMKKVVVNRQSDGSMEGHYEFSMMGKDMSYVLSVKENLPAGIVEWKLVKSDFFTVNSGKWTVTSTGPKSCHVKYWLDVDFSFSVPSFILKGIIKTTLPTMVDQFYKRAKTL
jgi:ribosome-associated toxin RatA of RatAB toxin-antitoxin module